MKIVPRLGNLPADSRHYAGWGHYWAVFRDGHIERVHVALRQCEIGAIRGDSVLCRLIPGMPHDDECVQCHTAPAY